MRTVTALRYVAPLREGGSLPAIVEADDGGLYVTKFVGAGQGPKALIAELVAGEIARTLDLPVPEIVLVQMDDALGRNEANQEIMDLLRASVGLNLGLRFLPNALAFNPLAQPPPAADLASRIVWFDAYVTNMDRTPRNVNLLLVQRQLWLIDHGAALYFHHDWGNYLARSRSTFPLIKDHVLLPFARQVDMVDADLRARLTDNMLERIVAQIPTDWLGPEAAFAEPDAQRQAYLAYLSTRRDAAALFVQEAVHAHRRQL